MSQILSRAPSLMCKSGRWGKKSFPTKMPMRMKSSIIRSRSYSNGICSASEENSRSRYSRNSEMCNR